MKGFSIKKKTPFQKHKELEEERKRKEEAEAAKIYDEFVDSFKAEEEKERESGGVKTFVRGGTVVPGQKPEVNSSSGKKPGGKYVPSFIPPSMLGQNKPKAFDDDDEDSSVFQQSSKKAEKDKPKAIDTMLEKLKKEQEARDERMKQLKEGTITVDDLSRDDGLGGRGGSFDEGDPYTTNIYLGNIAPDVDELILMREFGRFGPIASVKVMWPRTEEQRKALRNCGFVSFMRRDDAERALMALNGLMLHDYEMRIGWGKAVPLPPIPIYPPPGSAGAAAAAAVPSLMTTTRSKPEPPWGGGSVIGAVGVSQPSGGGAGDSVPWSTGQDRGRDEAVHVGSGADVEVKIPSDLRLRYIIDTLAVYVLKDGCEFEQVVMELEQKTPEYAFLYDLNSPEHIYYRWRLYSLCEGDTLHRWRVEPFVMVAGGQRWVPPAMTAGEASVATAAQRGGQGVERERQLSDLERDKYEDLLRKLTVEREDVKEAMVFALDNADACGEVVDILYEALTLPETPIPLKIARLFLVNDILQNSTAPVRNASRYRSKIEAVLPNIFESLQETYRGVETRITQEALRRHVLRVLRTWRERYLFSDDFLNGLQATFLQTSVVQPKASTASHSEDDPVTADPSGPTGRPDLRAELELLSVEDLERRCRINGLSNKGGADNMVARLLSLDLYLNANNDSAPTQALVPSSLGVFSGVPAPVDIPPELLSAVAEAPTPSATAIAAPPPSPAVHLADMPAAVVQSRWTTVDEEEEKQQIPHLPISKWLQQEQEAAAAAAAEAAARAAEQLLQESIFSDDDEEAGATMLVAGGPLFGNSNSGDLDRGQRAGQTSKLFPGPPSVQVAEQGGAGGVTMSNAAEEERRKRLREIELSCARLEAQLEEEGLERSTVDQRVTEHRNQLQSELERSSSGHAAGASAADKTALLERWRTKREARAGDKGASDHHEVSRDRSRSRERRDDKEKDRLSSKDRDREREREKDRRDRDSRDSRDKERARDSVHSHEKERERDNKDRDRDRGRDSRDRSKDRAIKRERSRSADATRRSSSRRSKSPANKKSSKR